MYHDLKYVNNWTKFLHYWRMYRYHYWLEEAHGWHHQHETMRIKALRHNIKTRPRDGRVSHWKSWLDVYVRQCPFHGERMRANRRHAEEDKKNLLKSLNKISLFNQKYWVTLLLPRLKYHVLKDNGLVAFQKIHGSQIHEAGRLGINQWEWKFYDKLMKKYYADRSKRSVRDYKLFEKIVNEPRYKKIKLPFWAKSYIAYEQHHYLAAVYHALWMKYLHARNAWLHWARVFQRQKRHSWANSFFKHTKIVTKLELHYRNLFKKENHLKWTSRMKRAQQLVDYWRKVLPKTQKRYAVLVRLTKKYHHLAQHNPDNNKYRQLLMKYHEEKKIYQVRVVQLKKNIEYYLNDYKHAKKSRKLLQKFSDAKNLAQFEELIKQLTGQGDENQKASSSADATLSPYSHIILRNKDTFGAEDRNRLQRCL